MYYYIAMFIMFAMFTMFPWFYFQGVNGNTTLCSIKLNDSHFG